MPDRISQLESMLQQDPEDAFCLYALAQEYAGLGELRRAIEFFERTIAVDPGQCYAYFHKAVCQDRDGDAVGAVATLRDGVRAAADSGDAKALQELRAFLDTLE